MPLEEETSQEKRAEVQKLVEAWLKAESDLLDCTEKIEKPFPTEQCPLCVGVPDTNYGREHRSRSLVLFGAGAFEWTCGFCGEEFVE